MIPNGGRLIFLNQDPLTRHRYDLVCFGHSLIIGKNMENNDSDTKVGVLSHYKQTPPQSLLIAVPRPPLNTANVKTTFRHYTKKHGC